MTRPPYLQGKSPRYPTLISTIGEEEGVLLALSQTRLVSSASCRIVPTPSELSWCWYSSSTIKKTELCHLFLHQKQKNIIPSNISDRPRKIMKIVTPVKVKVFLPTP
jgi:hypothetical protein